MTDKEKLELIAEAVRDMQRGVLNNISFFTVIASIVILQEQPSEEILAWAKKSIKEYEEVETCVNCVHGPVCGMYLLLFNATEDMREYEELSLRFELELYKTLAVNCHRYEEYKS